MASVCHVNCICGPTALPLGTAVMPMNFETFWSFPIDLAQFECGWRHWRLKSEIRNDESSKASDPPHRRFWTDSPCCRANVETILHNEKNLRIAFNWEEASRTVGCRPIHEATFNYLVLPCCSLRNSSKQSKFPGAKSSRVVQTVCSRTLVYCGRGSQTIWRNQSGSQTTKDQ